MDVSEFAKPHKPMCRKLLVVLVIDCVFFFLNNPNTESTANISFRPRKLEIGISFLRNFPTKKKTTFKESGFPNRTPFYVD